MSKIDLSHYDFKEVLEWVSAQFPDDKTLNDDLSYTNYTINGYVFNNASVYRLVSKEHLTLRFILQKIKKEESKQKKTISVEDYAHLKLIARGMMMVNTHCMTQEQSTNIYYQIVEANKLLAKIEAEFPGITK
jgi:acetolactate synthase small subunit